MANIWDKFDSLIDNEALRKEVEEAEKNGGNATYKEVPEGTYEVSVDKMEPTESKAGDPMISIWFKIEAGEYKDSRIFYNQVIKNHFGVAAFNNLLRSMDLDCVHVIEDNGKHLYQSISQYADLIMDAAEEIDSANLTFQLEYGKNKKGYNTFKISDVFEN